MEVAGPLMRRREEKEEEGEIGGVKGVVVRR